ncbi:hypothetical protein C2G38_2041602 [Gigaspora rosea]|uniref:Uncharacterized protein n=1 Tax=Gigaspora rosea TaxID=44941 RepID=A0A397USX4_9GLOM|nr:hypothetical protein C2G38_2041602 [Gigaspora rosea]
MSNPKYKLQRNLFLQAFARIQNQNVYIRKSPFDKEQVDSVASIHGLPYKPYDLLPDKDIAPNDWHPSELEKKSARPGGYCHHGIEKITNPLRSYTLPQDLETLFLAGDSPNPTKRPYIPDANTPFTPKGYSTVRHPTTNYTSDKSDTSLSVVTDCSTVLCPSIAQTFQYIDNWNKFSNHGDSQFKFANDKVPPTKNFGHYASIEIVHDSVHGSIGGKDRLTAIWQAINPNAWIENSDKATFTEGTFTEQPHKKLTRSTPLTTFRKSETKFWTSNGVRYIEDLGYTYLELQDYKDPNELKNYVINLYHPNICFARGKETQCANCIARPDAVVHACKNNDECIKLEDVLTRANLYVFDEGPDHNHNYEQWSKQYLAQVYPPQKK